MSDSEDDSSSSDEMQPSIWIPSMEEDKDEEKTIPVKCKGCRKKFEMKKMSGQLFSGSPSVKAFYKHCIEDCVAYEQSGIIVTCDDCRSIFINIQNKKQHFQQKNGQESCCIQIQIKKGIIPPNQSKTRPDASGEASCNEVTASTSKANPRTESQDKNQGKQCKPSATKTTGNEKSPSKSGPKKEQNTNGRRSIGFSSSDNDDEKYDDKDSGKGTESPDSNDSFDGKRMKEKETNSRQDAKKNDETSQVDTISAQKSEVEQRLLDLLQMNDGGMEFGEGKAKEAKNQEVRKPKKKMGPLSRTSCQSSSHGQDDKKNDDPSTSPSKTSKRENSSNTLNHEDKTTSPTPSHFDAKLMSPTPSTSAASTSSSSNVPKKPRPGPASRTGREQQYVPVPSAPSQAAIKQVQAEQNLRGKDLAHLRQAFPGRRRSTPSSSKSSKRKPKRSYSPTPTPKKRKRKEDSGSSDEDSDAVPEYDSDGEPVPTFIRQLKPVDLEPKDYLAYIPKKAKSADHFDSTVPCFGCKETFPCQKFSRNSTSNLERRSEPKPIYSDTYYIHCLKKCDKYMSCGRIKNCNKCYHRFLDEAEFKTHQRSQCKQLRKTVKLTKYKANWMNRELFIELLDKSKRINDRINCNYCHMEFKDPNAIRRGDNYEAGLQLYAHWIDQCPSFEAAKPGQIMECETCNFKYLNQDDYEKFDGCFKPSETSRHGKPGYK